MNWISVKDRLPDLHDEGCIDADALVRENYGQYGAIDTLALEAIKAAPTIIPASEGET